MNENYLYKIEGIKNKGISISIDTEYYILYGLCLPDKLFEKFKNKSNFIVTGVDLDIMIKRVKFYIQFYQEIDFSLSLNPTMEFLEDITELKRKLNSRITKERNLKRLISLYVILEGARINFIDVVFEFIKQSEL